MTDPTNLQEKILEEASKTTNAIILDTGMFNCFVHDDGKNIQFSDYFKIKTHTVENITSFFDSMEKTTYLLKDFPNVKNFMLTTYSVDELNEFTSILTNKIRNIKQYIKDFKFRECSHVKNQKNIARKRIELFKGYRNAISNVINYFDDTGRIISKEKFAQNAYGLIYSVIKKREISESDEKDRHILASAICLSGEKDTSGKIFTRDNDFHHFLRSSCVMLRDNLNCSGFAHVKLEINCFQENEDKWTNKKDKFFWYKNSDGKGQAYLNDVKID